MYLGFWILIISVITGQITRVPGLGVATDLLVPVYLGWWALNALRVRRPVPFRPIFVWAVVFLGYLLGGLLFRIHEIPAVGGELGSLLYWIRLAAYLALLVPFADMLDRDREQTLHQFWWAICGTGVALSLLGFVQLILFPDFSFMAQYGWDPHQGRLLSTWYDPNFLGGFLGVALSIVTARVLVHIRAQGMTFLQGSGLVWLGSIAVMLFALFLTYSRSALLAYLIGIGVLTLMLSRIALVVAIAIVVAAIGFSPRLQERVQGALELDVTASLRVENWLETIEDIEQNPLIGIGYNSTKYQSIVPSELNSASGRDSSLLTLWLTSGIIGLSLFVSMIGAQMLHWVRQGMQSKSLIEQTMSYGAIAAWSAILVHSMFVNSIFFPHILIFLIILLAI